MNLAAKDGTLSANEAACVTGVPLKHLHRIPVHDIAGMLASGDTAEAIRADFPRLSNAQIQLGRFYAHAYPRRG